MFRLAIYLSFNSCPNYVLSFLVIYVIRIIKYAGFCAWLPSLTCVPAFSLVRERERERGEHILIVFIGFIVIFPSFDHLIIWSVEWKQRKSGSGGDRRGKREEVWGGKEKWREGTSSRDVMYERRIKNNCLHLFIYLGGGHARATVHLEAQKHHPWVLSSSSHYTGPRYWTASKQGPYPLSHPSH